MVDNTTAEQLCKQNKQVVVFVDPFATALRQTRFLVSVVIAETANEQPEAFMLRPLRFRRIACRCPVNTNFSANWVTKAVK
jgi:hypothetical protein